MKLALAAIVSATLATGAIAAPGDPEQRDIRPADQARAQGANLRLADLPRGFRSFARSNAKAKPPVCGNFRPDLSDLTITGEAGSPAFLRADGTTIFSSAEVYRTLGEANASWRRTARKEALPCIAQQLERESATGAVQIDIRSYVQARGPALGDRSTKFRFVAVVESQGRRVRMWIDLLTVGSGRADASLVVFTVRRPPPVALEGSLLGKLARRLGV